MEGRLVGTAKAGSAVRLHLHYPPATADWAVIISENAAGIPKKGKGLAFAQKKQKPPGTRGG
jgi:hypothetical protein